MTIIPKKPDQEWFNSYLNPSLIQSRTYSIDTPQVKIKLDQNESPFDWPAEFKQSIAEKLAEAAWNRYPNAYSKELEGLVADYAGVSADAILLSPGSNHLICMLLNMLNKHRQGKLVIARPSFALYEQHCRYEGIPYEAWPLDAGLQYDLSALPELPPQSLLVFASPNNPVGNVLSRADLSTLLTANPQSFFIADEAYFEFASEPYTPLLATHSNLIIIRTFSKTMGAAGVRLGYCIASANVIAQLRKVMVPYLLNHFTLIAACEALKNKPMLAKVKENVKAVIAEWDKLYAGLTDRASGRFEIIPSLANFLLLRWPTQEACQRAYQALIEKGILLRNVSAGPGLQGCLRLTVGTAHENEQVIVAFENL